MSATGRGKERHERDFYETPEHAVAALLRHVDVGTRGQVFEPGCGTGAIGDALQNLTKRRGWWRGCDIDQPSVDACTERGLSADCWDFLSKPAEPGDIVMNPPYKLAAEFIRHALATSDDSAKVCALLRLNFLGSSRRRLDLVGPKSRLARVVVLAHRPSFTGNGKTDACEYAWFVWTHDHTGPAQLAIETGRP